MRKLPSALLIALAFVLLVFTGLAVVRAERARDSDKIDSVHGASSTAEAAQDQESSDDSLKVIRFVSHPAPMPPFSMKDLDGQVVSTVDMHGKVVFVAFWATWCPPCREEIPILIDLTNRYKDRLEVIGVSEDDAPASDVRAFAKQAGINYPIVMGGEKLSQEYGGVPVLPTSFVVNPDGRVVQKHVGVYPVKVYENEIRALLGMPVDVKVETFEDEGQIFLKNAANATVLPGVDFTGLTPDQKRIALKRMNSQNCTCGCALTIAQCRIIEGTCDVSTKLAASIIREVKTGKPASPPQNTAKN